MTLWISSRLTELAVDPEISAELESPILACRRVPPPFF